MTNVTVQMFYNNWIGRCKPSHRAVCDQWFVDRFASVAFHQDTCTIVARQFAITPYKSRYQQVIFVGAVSLVCIGQQMTDTIVRIGGVQFLHLPWGTIIASLWQFLHFLLDSLPVCLFFTQSITVTIACYRFSVILI